MKILIDEQLPTKLKHRFEDTGFQVSTVRDMEWLGKQNGELLKLLTLHNFNVLITNDKKMHYQQKLAGMSLYLININSRSNRYEDVLPKIADIKKILFELEDKISPLGEGNYITLPGE